MAAVSAGTTTATKSTAPQSDQDVLKVIVYSDDRTVREQIRLSLGSKIASDLPPVVLHEFATYRAALKAMDNELFDAAVFDGEAVPGGMGLAHQVCDEIPGAPPIVILVARMMDAWLATWSNADCVSPYPVDPIRLPQDVAQVVRDRRAGRRSDLTADDILPGVGSRHGVEDVHDMPDLPGTKRGPGRR